MEVRLFVPLLQRGSGDGIPHRESAYLYGNNLPVYFYSRCQLISLLCRDEGIWPAQTAFPVPLSSLLFLLSLDFKLWIGRVAQMQT